MTASRREPSRRDLALALLAALTACRAGLPPDPPGADPTHADAAIPPYHPPANPYDTSAFAGSPAAPAGHETMHHGAGHAPMDHTPSPAPAAGAHTPAPTDHRAHAGKAAADPTDPRR